MMKTVTIVKGRAVSFNDVLFLLFFGLKLAGAIEWSWLWVAAPLWAPLMGVLCLYTVAATLKWARGVKDDEPLRGVEQRAEHDHEHQDLN